MNFRTPHRSVPTAEPASSPRLPTPHRGEGSVLLLLFSALLCPTAHSQDQPIPASATTDATYLIDLPTVLRLAGAQNLDVQMARAKLAEARAENESATLKFFPSLTAG